MMTIKQIEAIVENERRRVSRNNRAVKKLIADSSVSRQMIAFWTSELRRARAAEKNGVSRG